MPRLFAPWLAPKAGGDALLKKKSVFNTEPEIESVIGADSLLRRR
jgi:hypothetical protein